MSLLPLFLLWFHTVLSQDQWRLVHPDGSVEAVWGSPQLRPEKKAEVVRAWVWSGLRAPRRVSPDQIGREKLPDDPGRLTVHVARRAAGKAPDDLRLIAAPFDMWREVPEAALPCWPVPKDGLLSIPLDPGRIWRLRVAGHNEGSWWVTVRPGQKSATLTAAPAAGIEIAVLDPAGKAASNLNASLQEATARGGGAAFWAKQHGEAARILVPGLPDEGEVSLTIMTPGLPPLVVRGRPSGLPHQVRLATGAELTGRLVDSKGAAVAGVPVEAEGFASAEMPQVMAVKSRSGADGAWRLRGLPAKVAWSARAVGFVPLTETVDVQGGVKTDLGTRILAPGTTLAVKVIDDGGATVPGARVYVEAGRFTATADVRGIARLEGLPAAPVEVKGMADGHLAGKSTFNLPFPQDPQLVLLRAFVVTGRLVDTSGSPILRGIAQLNSATCRNEVPLREGGRFQLDLPPLTGAAELVLRSPATQELRLHLDPGQAGETRDLGDLAAPAGLAVTGRQGSPHIVTQDGWDVSWLLRLLGAPPVLSPERPLQMTGPTAGQYSVSLDGESVVVSVTSDHPGEGRLE
jgi:hypothetical protein